MRDCVAKFQILVSCDVFCLLVSANSHMTGFYQRKTLGDSQVNKSLHADEFALHFTQMSEKGCLYSTNEIASGSSSKFFECSEIINKSILAQSALLQNHFLPLYCGLELKSSPKPWFLQPTRAGNPGHALLQYEEEKLQVPSGFSCLSKCCRLGEVSLSALPTWRRHQHH